MPTSKVVIFNIKQFIIMRTKNLKFGLIAIFSILFVALVGAQELPTANDVTDFFTQKIGEGLAFATTGAVSMILAFGLKKLAGKEPLIKTTVLVAIATYAVITTVHYFTWGTLKIVYSDFASVFASIVVLVGVVQSLWNQYQLSKNGE